MAPSPLPVGTQVVVLTPNEIQDAKSTCPPGSVGVVVGIASAPENTHLVRLTNGAILTFPRAVLAIRKHYQSESAQHSRNRDSQPDFNQFVIYRCVVGSQAFGLDVDGSDHDRRGIFLPPADIQWSLFGVPEQIENNETQECYWELEKFILLALKANPNILECLYSPLVEFTTPLADELLSIRSIFLSQLVYQTYNGYVLSQFNKLSQDLRNKGAIRWKHAMHLIRLLFSGIAVLNEGVVPLRMEQHRNYLLDLRNGKFGWEQVNQRRLQLHKEFETAFANTKLPEYPDYEQANAFLLKARQSMVL